MTSPLHGGGQGFESLRVHSFSYVFLNRPQCVFISVFILEMRKKPAIFHQVSILYRLGLPFVGKNVVGAVKFDSLTSSDHLRYDEQVF